MIAIISIVEGAVDTADCGSGSAGFLGYLQISLVTPQHISDFETLRQGEEFVDSAQILKEGVTFFLILQTEYCIKQLIHSVVLKFLIHDQGLL